MLVRACLSVCPSILAPGVRTGDPIETGQGAFDALERRKDDSASIETICSTWHVARATCYHTNPCKNHLVKAAEYTNGWTQLNFVGQ